MGDFMFYAQKLARELNRSKYLKAMYIPLSAIVVYILLTVLPFLISLIFSKTSLFLPREYSRYNSILKCLIIASVGLLSYLFHSTLSIGEEAWYSGRIANKKNCIKRFFYWFRPSNSIKALTLKSVLLCLKLFWTIVFLLPSIVTASVIFLTAFNGGIEIYLLIALAVGSLLLLLCGLIFRFIFIQRYFLSEYILTQNPHNTTIQSIKQSKNLLEGQLNKVVIFKLSFIPIFLSCLLILPVFFVYPHYKLSRTIIAKELMI